MLQLSRVALSELRKQPRTLAAIGLALQQNSFFREKYGGSPWVKLSGFRLNAPPKPFSYALKAEGEAKASEVISVGISEMSKGAPAVPPPTSSSCLYDVVLWGGEGSGDGDTVVASLVQSPGSVGGSSSLQSSLLWWDEGEWQQASLDVRAQPEGDSWAVKVESGDAMSSFSVEGPPDYSHRQREAELVPPPPPPSALTGTSDKEKEADGGMKHLERPGKIIVGVVYADDPTFAGDGRDGGDAAAVSVKSNMQGKVVKIQARVGDMVRKGDPLVVVEAMKMETVVRSSVEGRVVGVRVKEGEAVRAGQTLSSVLPMSLEEGEEGGEEEKK
uniref:Lipoyl-binding domain-containing protein n=1 Tax=Chromera velia CCMP2878 TaxID=1169474 RepID=A0A0G4HKA3_9ALVE|eukprot:Cvel_1102.t1-p1 / transcript=Cvel_1102.t1 / gene=Cvel_1102 / organism=Chromera_velia_CCMP2878 / gene_product=hypothetical protein / transcript_product=hypothetical protein / location=Cvel_scaffold36:27724-32753(+) / protein_length=329 / sequence_SO=supercontig / SO=protein_coding / is_pseudo=false